MACTTDQISRKSNENLACWNTNGAEQIGNPAQKSAYVISQT